MSSDSSAPPEAVSLLFARGVIARLALWPVLRAAVENGWGGGASAQKRTWLASELVDAFEASLPPRKAEQPDDEYVALTLMQAMEDEFDVVIEDGSAEPLARDIVVLWAAARTGNEALIQEWEARADKTRGKKVDVNVQEVVDEAGGDDESDWESDDEEGKAEEEEAPQLLDQAARAKPEPVVDEDGFTLVQGKGKK